MDNLILVDTEDPTFWHHTDQAPLNAFIHEGPVKVYSGGALVRRWACLGNDILALKYDITDKQIHFYTRLTRKLLIPFRDFESTDYKHGFRLFGGQANADFYTENETELTIWLDLLRNKVILGDFASDYSIIRLLDEGSQAKIYTAEEISTGRIVAVKCLDKSQIPHKEDARDACLNSMKYHRMLNHPRVVNLDYVYEDSDEIYLVMEYVRAGSLLQRICDKGNLSERDTAKLISNLLETLTFLHDRRIVHRDVKVDNILMASPNNDYDIKVTDFGFCTSLDDENIDNMCGTPSYIAPELFQNQSIHDCKIDVYSAGVVAYICLVGKLPYNVDPSQMQALFRENRENAIVYEREAWSAISREALKFQLQLTEANPANRPSAREALSSPWLQTISKLSEERLLVIPPKSEIPLLTMEGELLSVNEIMDSHDQEQQSVRFADLPDEDSDGLENMEGPQLKQGNYSTTDYQQDLADDDEYDVDIKMKMLGSVSI